MNGRGNGDLFGVLTWGFISWGLFGRAGLGVSVLG